MPTTAAPSEPLAFEGVSFAIGGRRILTDVTLAVRPGEILCLLGPSGCGKTTLLRIAAGIERQGAGSVWVSGEVVADDSRFVPPERRHIGYVFQDLALFPHMTVAANVAYGTRGRGAEEALVQVGLAGTGRRYPHQLSGGQQQRVALARALLPAPSVVLFDEPFSSLDRSLRDAVRQDVVAVLRARGATAVIVTHDAEEALALADRIALMRDGRIVQLATPEAIWRAPADLAAARVFSAVTVFPAHARDGVADTPLGPVPAPFDGPATVALRPEAIRAGKGAVARVLARRFLGGAVEVTAAVGEHVVLVRADPAVMPESDTVRLAVDPERAIVLKGLP